MPPFIKKPIVWILTWEARITLMRHKPRIIAISGSVGKTATKDAIFAALSSSVHIRKSEKSLNSEFGVPLTILGLDSGWRDPLKWLWNIGKGLYVALTSTAYPKWLVLEVGADRPGDIKSIASWLRPDVVVLTHVPEVPVHVEFFRHPEDVVREKMALVQYVQDGGTVIVNGDDKRLRDAISSYAGKRAYYGLEEFNDFAAKDSAILYEADKPIGVRFEAVSKNMRAPVALRGALGIPRVYAALAALAVAEAIGADLKAADEGLRKYTPPPGRMRVIDGVNGSIILDDTYNSSPAAAMSALDTLKSINAERRIALLGDMLELGKYSADQHKSVGAYAGGIVDKLVTVGFRSRTTAEAAIDAGLSEKNVFQYELNESRRAGEEMSERIKPGDVILVKGSQSIRMERAVEELMAEPGLAPELLVRQDKEWKSR